MLPLLWDTGIIRVAPVKAFPSNYYKQEKLRLCKDVKQWWYTSTPTTDHNILWAALGFGCCMCVSWVSDCSAPRWRDRCCLSRLRQRSLLWTDASSWLRRSWIVLRSVWALPWPSWRRLRRLQMRARGEFSPEEQPLWCRTSKSVCCGVGCRGFV